MQISLAINNSAGLRPLSRCVAWYARDLKLS